jgi:hypothetical protein
MFVVNGYSKMHSSHSGIMYLGRNVKDVKPNQNEIRYPKL